MSARGPIVLFWLGSDSPDLGELAVATERAATALKELGLTFLGAEVLDEEGRVTEDFVFRATEADGWTSEMSLRAGSEGWDVFEVDGGFKALRLDGDAEVPLGSSDLHRAAAELVCRSEDPTTA